MAKRKIVAKKSTKKKRNAVRRVGARRTKSMSKQRAMLELRKIFAGADFRRLELKPLKLDFDLVPETQWGKSLRMRVPRPIWDKLRKEVYAQAGFKCQICGAEGRLNCHEIWEYDEKNLIQRLTGLRAVCDMCHHVMHFGRSSILADQGRLDIKEVIKHFMKVNDVSRKEFEAHYRAAICIWQDRSQSKWVLDFGQWAALLPEKPA